jgi:cytosine/adenosine deaminase-related metal-dependent hydrolase
MALPDWIRQVVAWRRDQATCVADPSGTQANAVVEGLRESLACGVTALGDIAASSDTPCRSGVPVTCISFRELRALHADGIAEQVRIAHKFVERAARDRHFRVALSPHAPYSTHRNLVLEACRLSRRFRLPLAMHLAESEEEIELLQSGKGAFRDLLVDFDAWQPSAFPGGMKTRDYLEMLDQACRSLVIHGNYLVRSDWEYLARRAATMAVVYCPRTHDFFQHARYPLNPMLRAGVRVVVGTDSRASNPDLNLLEDLRFVASSSGVHPEVVLHMGTDWAAAALDCEKDAGTLMPGGPADLAVVGLDCPATGDAWRDLFESTQGVREVISRGSIVAR